MKTVFFRSLLGISISTLSAAVGISADDDKKAAAGEKITFEDHVLPILENRCLNCHNPDESKGGLDLSSYGATMSGGSGGEVVVPEDPNGSRLYTLTAHIETPKMPPEKAKSPDKELEILKKWIEGGLLETSSSKAKKSDKPKLDMNLITATGKPDEAAMPENLILEPEVVTDRPNSVPALAHSPWAPIVAVAGQKQVLLYHSEDFDLLGVLAYPEGFPQSLNFSPNGSLLSCGGGRGGKSGGVVVWDVKTGERVIEVGKEFDIVLGSDISADHRRVVMGGPGKNIKVWDTVAGEQVASIKKHPDWMLTADISPDGVLFATGGRNAGLYVWETEAGLEFFTLKGHTSAVTDLAWRPDGNILGSVSEDGQAILWEMNEGKQVKKWAAHSGGALSIAFSPNGQFIATAGRDKNVKLWKADGTAVRTIKASEDIVMSVAFSHDSNRVFSGDYSGAIKAWNVADGVEIAQIDSNPPPIDKQIVYATERIAKARGEIPKLEEGIKTASAELTNARNKLNDVTKQFNEANGKKVAAENLTKTLDAQVKSLTAQVQASKKNLDAKNADAKAKTDAYNNEVKAQAAAKAEVTKWTGEYQKADAALKTAATNLATAKAAAEKPVLDDATQKALNAAVAAYSAADTAKKQADAKVAPLKAADDAANQKVGAANVAKNAAVTKFAGASDAEKPAAQQALDAATKALAQAQAAKAATGKALAEASATQSAAGKKLAEAGNALKPLRDKENAAKAALEKAKQLFVQRTNEHNAALKNATAQKGQLDNANKNLAAADAKVKAALGARDAANVAAKAASDDFNGKNKALAEANTKIKTARDDAAKNKALVDNLTKQKDAAAKLVAAVQKKEADAKKSIEVAKAEVKTNEFLVKKFKAAAINLEAKEKSEELEEMTEELGEIAEEVAEKIEEHKAATTARVEAEKTLANAKKTVETGKKELAQTTTSVLEKAMRLAAARAVAEVREDVIGETPSDVEPDTEANPETAAADSGSADAPNQSPTEVSDMPEDPDEAEIVTVAAQTLLTTKSREEIEKEIGNLQARLGELENALKQSYSQAGKTKETVAKASDVAAKTPAVISERTKIEGVKAKEKQMVEQEKAQKEKQISEQTNRIKQLKAEFEKANPSREELKKPE